MSGTYTAIAAGTLISGYFANESAKDAAEAAEEGASTVAAGQEEAALTSAEAQVRGAEITSEAQLKGMRMSVEQQQEALDYLREVDKLPRGYRESALTRMGEEYGFTLDEEGNVISGGESIAERARTSPFYTTARDQGEEAILRNASMTGGLRSGNVQDALARSSEDLYLDSYLRELQGVSGLAGLPSGASEIAMSQRGIGNTYGAGYSGAGAAMGGGVTGAGMAMGAGQANAAAANAAGITAAGQARQAGYQGMGQAFTGGVQNLLYAKGQGLI